MPSKKCASACFGLALTAASNCSFASGNRCAFQAMTPWLNSVVGAAPAAGARGCELLRLRAHLAAASLNFFCCVVEVRQPVVRLGGVRIDLDRLLVGRFGLRRIPSCRDVERADVGVALGALRHLGEHLVELGDRLVVLARRCSPRRPLRSRLEPRPRRVLPALFFRSSSDRRRAARLQREVDLGMSQAESRW